MKTMLGIACVSAVLSALSLVGQDIVTDPSAEVSTSTRTLEEITSEPKEVPRKVNGLSTRAWSTTVGWRPGASAFADPIHNEGGLTLFTWRVARDK